MLWRAPGRIHVSGPAGWAPVVRSEVRHQDGDAVVAVEGWPVLADDVDLDTLAQTHTASLQADSGPSAATDSGLYDAMVLGNPHGREHTMTWTGPDQVTNIAHIGYTVSNGWFYAVTRLVSDGDTTKAEEAADVAASVRLVTPVQLDRTSSPLGPRGPVSTEALTAGWGTKTTPEAGPTHILTTEESFAIAARYGVNMLPGVDTTTWDTLDPSMRELAAAVAHRSLTARRVPEDPGFSEATELAASHDVLIVASTEPDPTDEGPTHVVWYALRPDRMVRVHRAGDGQIGLTTFDTAALPQLMAADFVNGKTRVLGVLRDGDRVTGRESTWSAGEGHEGTELVALLTGTSGE